MLDELESWLLPDRLRLATANATRASAGAFFGSLALVIPKAMSTSAAVMNSPAQYAHFVDGSG